MRADRNRAVEEPYQHTLKMPAKRTRSSCRRDSDRVYWPLCSVNSKMNLQVLVAVTTSEM